MFKKYIEILFMKLSINRKMLKEQKEKNNDKNNKKI